jgi:hypothetical protein
MIGAVGSDQPDSLLIGKLYLTLHDELSILISDANNFGVIFHRDFPVCRTMSEGSFSENYIRLTAQFQFIIGTDIKITNTSHFSNIFTVVKIFRILFPPAAGCSG